MKYYKFTSWVNFFRTTVLLFLVFSCSENKHNINGQFEELYQKEEKIKNQEFDTISQLYHIIDSVSNVVEDNRLKYLKNLVHGQLYYRIGEFDHSIEKLRNALLFVENGSTQDSLRAKIQNSIGVVFMAKCQYDSAVYYLNKSLKIWEKQKNKPNSQITLFNQAQLYFEMENFDKANIIIDEILTDPANKDIELMALHLKANLYGVKGEIDSAIYLSKTAIIKMDATKNMAAYSRFLNNLSLCYNEKAKLDSAKYFCYQSYLYDSLQNNKINMGANLMLMGEIFVKKKKPQTAEKYFNQAYHVFDENKSYDNKRGAILSLKKLALQEKKFEKAMALQDSIISIDKMIGNIDILRTIALLNIQFEIDKKNELLKTQKNELRWQRRMEWIILILSIVLIVTIYLFYQNKSKKERLKSAKQQEVLADLVFEAEQNEQIRIAKDLHDSVGQKLAVTQMHLSMSQDAQVNHDISNMIKDTIDEIRAISHNLLPPDLSKGLFYAIEMLCDQINYSNLSPEVHLVIPKNPLNTKMNRNFEMITYRIIQELCSNSIKHSSGNNIWIDIKVDSSVINISYIDDGVGFDETNLKSTGVGLKSIKDRVSKLNGIFKFTSEMNNGVKYEFQFNSN